MNPTRVISQIEQLINSSGHLFFDADLTEISLHIYMYVSYDFNNSVDMPPLFNRIKSIIFDSECLELDKKCLHVWVMKRR